MNLTKIDWPWKPLYTWNPVVGCKTNCSYCYGKRINDRFKMVPKWNKPEYFPIRLHDPMRRKKPANIFVGSMCDLFGDWVTRWWIQSVIDMVGFCSQHTFMFLTKNPHRYKEFDFPENCWLGVTITSGKDYEKILDLPYKKSFVSVEPIQGEFYGGEWNSVDLVIVGADSRKGAAPPKREWVDSIKHHNIYYKNNITKHFPDLENK